MKQFKRGFLLCRECGAEMHAETATSSAEGAHEPERLVCRECDSSAPLCDILDKPCLCGATPVQKEAALSAPARGIRLYVTSLSKIQLFHNDGRGLEARDACTSCTSCFVCRQLLNTQACGYDEIPLEGLRQHTGLTHQYVHVHPECFAAYSAWREEYDARVREDEANKERAAIRREHCLNNALCLECEEPLSLIDRFAGRLRHAGCALKPKPKESGGAAKQRVNKKPKKTK